MTHCPISQNTKNTCTSKKNYNVCSVMPLTKTILIETDQKKITQWEPKMVCRYSFLSYLLHYTHFYFDSICTGYVTNTQPTSWITTTAKTNQTTVVWCGLCQLRVWLLCQIGCSHRPIQEDSWAHSLIRALLHYYWMSAWISSINTDHFH